MELFWHIVLGFTAGAISWVLLSTVSRVQIKRELHKKYVKEFKVLSSQYNVIVKEARDQCDSIEQRSSINGMVKYLIACGYYRGFIKGWETIYDTKSKYNIKNESKELADSYCNILNKQLLKAKNAEQTNE